jgi:hypothetical protein
MEPSTVKPIELVQLIKEDTPALLGKFSEKKAAALIRAALVQLGKQIDAMDKGVIQVAGLGNFRAMQVKEKKDEETKIVKKIVFRVVKPKVKATERTVE